MVCKHRCRRHLGQRSRPPEQGHIFFSSSKTCAPSFSKWDGWLVFATPSPFLRNDNSPLHHHHHVNAYLISTYSTLYTYRRIHYTRTQMPRSSASLLLHYSTILLSCFNAIRRQLHSAWAPGTPELCRHPVRHPQVPTTPHRRPQQPSATIPVSCVLTVLSLLPLLQIADERVPAHAGDLQLTSYQTIQPQV